MLPIFWTTKRGFSLIEYLVYITIFSILTLSFLAFVGRFFPLVREASALREVQDNAQTVREVLSQEVTQALSIYTPTSVFATSSSQLSLETKNSLPDNENTTYVDFYLDNSSLYLKREGQAASRITSQNITVDEFTVLLLSQASIPAVQVTFSLNEPSLGEGPIPFTFSISLRPNT
jgi:type II secretory pathway pseudopilin PulG